MTIDISDYLHIPYGIAKKFVKFGEPVRDSEIYADGCIGLLLAARNYDPNLGVPFEPYAKMKVLWHCRDARRSLIGRGGFKYIPFVQSDEIENIRVEDDIDRQYGYEWIEYQSKLYLTDYEQSIFFKRLQGVSIGELANQLQVTDRHVSYITRKCIAILCTLYKDGYPLYGRIRRDGTSQKSTKSSSQQES